MTSTSGNTPSFFASISMRPIWDRPGFARVRARCPSTGALASPERAQLLQCATPSAIARLDGGSMNGKSLHPPKAQAARRRMTPASEERRISGSVNCCAPEVYSL